ncbi:hypothetical protein WJX74_005742 [Apatococcus lobatus]|uniref:GED domain-containing protein n=1 Tax=Apatococcus lobatus TaxID=904363 RepID=A0AAW1QD44_9CHLO
MTQTDRSGSSTHSNSSIQADSKLALQHADSIRNKVASTGKSTSLQPPGPCPDRPAAGSTNAPSAQQPGESSCSPECADQSQHPGGGGALGNGTAAAAAADDNLDHMTLMQVMQQGTYGKFCQAVSPLIKENLLAMPDVELPCIIIMGNLSCGKSALAQQLTGCTAFSNLAQACSAYRPGSFRGSSQPLVQQPVSVSFWQPDPSHMQHMPSCGGGAPTNAPARHQEVCHSYGSTGACVSFDMPSLDSHSHNRPAGSPRSPAGDGLHSDGEERRSSQDWQDEIRIRCSCPQHFVDELSGLSWRCPLEVIDLPGIRAYPAAANRLSSAMYRDYSRVSDAILLCLAEASFSDLRSAQALAIAAEEAPSHVVICLTKTDLISTREAQTKVVDRLQGSAVDIQDFRRQPCFAVSASDSGGPGAAGTADSRCLPKAADVYLSADVVGRLGVNSLLRHVAGRCHEHIKQKWLPQVRAQLLPQIRLCQKDLQELGPAPQDLTKLGLIRSLQAHVKFQTLMKFLWTAPEMAVCISSQDLLHVFQDLPPGSIHRLLRKGEIPLRSLGAQLLSDHMAAPPSLQFYKQLQAVVEHVEEAISDWLSHAEYKQGILHCYLAALRDAEHLQRLQGFKEAISTGIDRAIDTDAVKQSVMALISPAISSLHASAKPSTSKLSFKLSKLDQLLRAAIIAEVVMPLKEDPAELAGCLLPSFKPVEKRAAAEERVRLLSRLQMLQQAIKGLDAIQRSA